jgi:hypothetical protein
MRASPAQVNFSAQLIGNTGEISSLCRKPHGTNPQLPNYVKVHESGGIG